MRVLLSFILLLFLGSCIRPEQNNTRERYVVTSRNLNIRSDPSKLSRAIGTLSKGDTIVALASDKYWIMISKGNQSGFISNEFLKKIEPYKSPFPFSFIENNSNWKSWSFWVITFISICIWVLTALWVGKYEKYLKKEVGVKTKNLSISPIIFFVAGILTGVLFLFWKDQLIESIFYKFTFNPIGKEVILWALLGQIFFIVAGLTIDFVVSIYLSGARYGILLFAIELVENLVILTITLYLTISLFLLAIIVLTIFFAMQYITMVSENGKSFSELITGR